MFFMQLLMKIRTVPLNVILRSVLCLIASALLMAHVSLVPLNPNKCLKW